MLGTLRWMFGYGSSDSSENEIKKERPNVVNATSFHKFIINNKQRSGDGNIIFNSSSVSELLASCNGKFFEEKILSDTISLSRNTYLQIASDSFSKNFLYFVQTCYQHKQINGVQSAEGEFDVGDAGIFGKFISKFESHQNMMRLLSSKLFAEFWGIVAEQFDDISASEAGEYTYEISQYMTNAINGQIYDESQFFRSVLSILITVYVKHKIVAEDLYNTKYSLFADLIQNSPIEEIINDLNIVIYLRNSAPEYDPNTRAFGKLPEIENLTAGSKIDLNFIHVDYEANSVDTMNFWY